MQKVIFDIEDRPPPAYYKEMAKIKLETSTVVVDKVKDKSDWVNAPEFVPRSLQTYPENAENHTMPNLNEVKIHPKDVHQIAKLQQQLLQRNALLQRAAQLSTLPQQFNTVNGGYPTPVLVNGLPHLLPRTVVQPQVQFMAHRPQFQQPLLRLQVNMQRPMPVPMIPTTLPAGYTANVTTIKSAFGSQVPAIVIKKKRKKRPKLRNEENELNVEKITDHNDNCTAAKESSPEDFSLATESLNDAISIQTDDECADSNPLIHNQDHREESHHEQQKAIRTGSAGELHSVTSLNGNHFPADLDLIQTAGNCAILTGSWPDLSQPQKDSLTSALSPMHSDFYGAYYENRQAAFSPESNESLPKEVEENVQLLTRNKDGSLDASDIQKRPIIVQSIGNETRSQIADPQNDILGFIPYQLRTLSMPDVHVIAAKAPKMCCSIM